jgi:hypothetical protein
MIQPLRTAHRWAFAFLAILLPTLVSVGIAKRHEYADSASSIREVVPTAQRSSHGLFRLVTARDRLQLFATTEKPYPELLVYLNESAEGTVQRTSRLVGHFRSGVTLSVHIPNTGAVILYSPTQNEVVDFIQLGNSQ